MGCMSDPRDLAGTWALRRRVCDRATGLHGAVRGSLEVTAHPDHLTWVESGQFTWWPASRPGEPVPSRRSAPVTRALRLARLDGDWWMQFHDGRPFHPWQPGQVVEHPCAADLYRGVVAIDPGRRRMRTLWDVTGRPRTSD